MTTFYLDDGRVDPVTLIEAGPCVVTQIKTRARDGYEAVQLGFELAKRLNKPLRGHLERAGNNYRHLQEFLVDDLADFEVGQTLDVSLFNVGDILSIRGKSKGRGFAGGVRRHNFRGGPKTHGQSDRHRGPGSIGGGTSPGKVWKGTRMAGHMGDAPVTVSGLRVHMIDAERNVIAVRGAVPGAKNGLLRISVQRRAKTPETES